MTPSLFMNEMQASNFLLENIYWCVEFITILSADQM